MVLLGCVRLGGTSGGGGSGRPAGAVVGLPALRSGAAGAVEGFLPPSIASEIL